ncbi:MAG: Rieske 2Fe-2S domain-containing protein [Steroidobacteraceae bacterium]
MSELDLERAICAAADLKEGECRGFTVGAGDWPLQGLVVKLPGRIVAFRNVCPHAGHPLNLRPNDFLSPDGMLIMCHSHGALFEKSTGLCVAGPCQGRHLRPIAIEVASGVVLLAGEDDPAG